MNITKETTGELTATLKIEIAESDYKEKVSNSLKDYQRKANIPGFRKGQVPFGHVNRLYGKSALVEEVYRMLDEKLSGYLRDEKINVLGGPLSNDEKTGEVDFSNQKDFVFYFDIALQPEINVDLSKFNVNLYHVQPDKEMLEKYLTKCFVLRMLQLLILEQV